MRCGIPRRVEVLPTGKQRDRDDGRGDRAVAEPVLQVERDEPYEHEQCDLPRSSLPAREPAAHDQQRQPEGRDERLRDAVHVLGRKGGEEQGSLVRGDRVEDAEHAGGRDEPRQHERAPRPRALARPAAESAGCSGQHRRQVDRSLGCRGVKRLVRRDLSDDQQ